MRVAVVASALLTACMVPTLLHAQTSFTVEGREVQIHGYLSEAFAWSSDNNYLRMPTSDGSFFTEAGVNVSARVTDKLRIGAQAYDRAIGELGKGHPYLDWAFVDYRWKDWLGVRAGKVKTSIGLYGDTQDQEFLHTWALLPQSVYPVDLRAVTVAHVGADVYGQTDIGRGGSLSYTAFAGSIPGDPRGGYRYGLEAVGGHLAGDVVTGRMEGGDVRWSTPLSGLMIGTSLVFNQRNFSGTLGVSPLPLTYETTADRIQAFFGEYTNGGLHAQGEYRAQMRRGQITAEIPGRPVVSKPGSDEPAWFASGAYRFSKRIEAGAYYSHYHVDLTNPPVAIAGPGRDHIYDRTATLRFDLTRFWDLKVEGHFMDGVGSPGQAHGFYPQDNPQGFNPTTHLLVVRTGLYF